LSIIVEHAPLPPPLGLDACAVCGAAIVWALTHAGHRRAVDVEPIAAGVVAWWVVELFHEVFPDGDPVDGVQRVRVRPRWRAPSSPAWSLHKATCQRCRLPEGDA
jgi:hypothetical protein